MEGNEKTIHELMTDEAKANLAYAEAALAVAGLEVEADALETTVRIAKAARDRAYQAQRAGADAITAHYRREAEARKAAVPS